MTEFWECHNLSKRNVLIKQGLFFVRRARVLRLLKPKSETMSTCARAALYGRSFRLPNTRTLVSTVSTLKKNVSFNVGS